MTDTTRPRADGRRYDCCDFCPDQKECVKIVTRCPQEDGTKRPCQIGQVCHECDDFDHNSPHHPYYERMFVNGKRVRL